MNTSTQDTINVRTVGDYLFDCVNFYVPEGIAQNIATLRDVPMSMPITDAGSDMLRLMKADLLKWIILGPGKVNNTSDADNGWSHSEGGYSLSDDDKRLMKDEANAIYRELEPESVFGVKRIRMRSAGIMPSYRDIDGMPIGRPILDPEKK